MNHLNVRGRLKAAVKVTHTSTGTYVIKGTIADNYSWSKDGEDKVNWVNFTRFTKTEPSAKYLDRLVKGAFVIVDGRLETNKNEVNGVVYNNIEVIAHQLEVPFPPKGTTDNNVSQLTDNNVSQPTNQESGNNASPEPVPDNIDLPF